MHPRAPSSTDAAARGGKAPRGPGSPGRRKLRALAAGSKGNFTRAQAHACGVTDDVLGRMCASGEVTRCHESVFRFGGFPPNWDVELHADVIAAGDHAVASRAAALRLHGVRNPAVPYRREVTRLGGGRSFSHPDVVYHRTPRLDEIDRTTVLGVPCTSRARTLIDLAAVVDGIVLLELADGLIDFQLCTRGHVHARALALCAGRRGAAFLLRLTAPGGEVAFRSWLERQGMLVLRWGGLPIGEWNVPIPGHPGAGVVDTLYLERRVVIEWDGLRFHAGARARQRDDHKGNAIAAAECVLLRFTWADVTLRPLYVVQTVARALGLPVPQPSLPPPLPRRLLGVSLR